MEAAQAAHRHDYQPDARETTHVPRAIVATVTAAAKGFGPRLSAASTPARIPRSRLTTMQAEIASRAKTMCCLPQDSKFLGEDGYPTTATTTSTNTTTTAATSSASSSGRCTSKWGLDYRSMNKR